MEHVLYSVPSYNATAPSVQKTCCRPTLGPTGFAIELPWVNGVALTWDSISGEFVALGL